jgi:hypothetical protein
MNLSIYINMTHFHLKWFMVGALTSRSPCLTLRLLQQQSKGNHLLHHAWVTYINIASHLNSLKLIPPNSTSVMKVAILKPSRSNGHLQHTDLIRTLLMSYRIEQCSTTSFYPRHTQLFSNALQGHTTNIRPTDRGHKTICGHKKC